MEKITLFLSMQLLCFTVNPAVAAIRCGNCGETPVPYPLSTGPTCGDQAYKIRCTAGTLWLDALNGSPYVINSINPQFQQLVIRPPPLAPNTCISSDFQSEGLKLDPILPFNVTRSNTVLLMNCTDSMFHLQVPVNCSSNNLCHAYMNRTATAAVCAKEAICCDFRTGGSQNAYVIRVHGGGCMAYQSFVNLDSSLPVEKWPPPGVELEWVLPQEPLCRLPVVCRELLFSRCLPDPANAGLKRCFCKPGRRWDGITRLCQKCRHGKTPAAGAILILMLSGILVHRQRRRTKREARKVLVKQREDILNANNNSGKSAKIFTGKEIKKSTNNFSKDTLLSSGGFGEVYKAVLDDGTVAAVKRPKPGNTKGISQVLNEVRILCQVNHRSLVKLLGCCVKLEQPVLVYEYIPNGTLFDHLQGKRSLLGWQRRLTIAHQTANRLAYLHSSAAPPIYHREVKSSNILLDENLNAKVSDFGLSQLVEIAEKDFSHINTLAQGTLGYLNPEYYVDLQLTDQSDVYSFGVVLLELLTSKKGIDFNREKEEERFVEAVDSNLKEGAHKVELETMKAMGNLAAVCLDQRRQNRPSMKEVTEEIEYIISIVSDEPKT